ncbi:MAG: sensor histidine kinase [Solirubrobacterales bacterium]
MIELGQISLPSAAANIEARRKVFSVVQQLTSDEIAAARLAAGCSEICRHTVGSGDGSQLHVGLRTRDGVLSIQLTLTGPDSFEHAATHAGAFDTLVVTVTDAGAPALRAGKELRRAHPPDEARTAQLRAIVQERSRDELMADVQAKNVELEDHQEHLEETVRERTVQLRDAMGEAESANEAKSQFLANMSHELRTPMNAIIGYTEMLIEDAEDSEQDETIPDLEKILAAGTHLLSLINDVLDLSKIEAGKMELYCETFDLAGLIEDTASTVESLVAKNGNELVRDVDENLGEMHADLTKVRQSLFNLLSNAAKFTSEGTITLSARRESGSDSEWIVLSVSDTGVGVPPEKLEKVFEEFSQADASTTREYGGTGLGLPITKRFCEMMGGEIDASSEAGQGTTFRIRMPAEVEDEPAAADDPDDQTAGARAPIKAGEAA